MKPRNHSSLLAIAVIGLTTGANLSAQTWERILPHPDYPAGDLSGQSAAGGRSLAFEPGSTPEQQRVYVGTVDYWNNPTITRLTPDAPNFPLDPAPEGVDGEPLGGCAWVPQMIQIPDHGFWAVGWYAHQTARDTTYYWKVRTSLTGDFGDWVTVDDFMPPSVSRRALSEANPQGIAASSTHVFVSGMVNDGSTWRWVVRRKEPGAVEGFTNVLDVRTAGRLRSRVCYFPGSGSYASAVLTVGKTAAIKIGKTSVSYWAVRRSLDGGANFQEEDRWTPSTVGWQAVPTDIACDPNTGYIYAIGGLGNSTTLPNGGWVIRVNRDGGDPSKWETLLEQTSGRGAAQRVAFGQNGTVYVLGHFDPTGSSPYMAVISNTPGESWEASFLNPSYPFGSFKCNLNEGAMAFGPDGKLYVTGEVSDYVEADLSFPGTWLALTRLSPLP